MSESTKQETVSYCVYLNNRAELTDPSLITDLCNAALMLSERVAELEQQLDAARAGTEAEELRQENERLRSELADEKEDAFFEAALKVEGGELDGWWDTTARTSLCRLGDELAQLGRFEKHPNGTGRRWFYRPVRSQ